MILITGSRGLIGSAIGDRLRLAGHSVRSFDLADDAGQDIRDREALAAALTGVTGVVHLAAVSRVVWAQRDPERTWTTNVAAFQALMGLIRESSNPPWIVFASSREVYGEPANLPVDETAPLRPMNVYARSKVAGEALVEGAAAEGLAANVARFSNVYGSILDHPDRVVPAFARAAATGGAVRLEGADHMFDFTHVDDVSRGLHRLVDATIAGQRLDPIHFVTGHGTTLRDLANIALAASEGAVTCELHAPRSYDVARFTGDPGRAKDMLGWTAEIGIAEGFEQLTDAFRRAQQQSRETAPRQAACATG
jgi:nucleoside-diphosphate-sugar epimerase